MSKRIAISADEIGHCDICEGEADIPGVILTCQRTTRYYLGGGSRKTTAACGLCLNAMLRAVAAAAEPEASRPMRRTSWKEPGSARRALELRRGRKSKK